MNELIEITKDLEGIAYLILIFSIVSMSVSIGILAFVLTNNDSEKYRSRKTITFD